MKYIKLILIFLFPVFLIQAQENVQFNKSLADSLGADELGMRTYVLVILKTGTNDTLSQARRTECFKSHFENMTKMTKEGKLMVAGPLDKNENQYRGIFILKVKDFDEAKALLQNDLTVKENIFEVEMYSWYGPAALPMYLPFHTKIQKKKIN